MMGSTPASRSIALTFISPGRGAGGHEFVRLRDAPPLPYDDADRLRPSWRTPQSARQTRLPPTVLTASREACTLPQSPQMILDVEPWSLLPLRGFGSPPLTLITTWTVSFLARPHGSAGSRALPSLIKRSVDAAAGDMPNLAAILLRTSEVSSPVCTPSRVP